MDIFEWLLTPEFVGLMMIIWALVWFQRKLVEEISTRVFKKDIKQTKLWRSLFVPAGPVGTGMLFGWMVTSYPYPEQFATSDWARIGYGLIAGILSMHAYRFLKEWFKDKYKSLKKKDEPSQDSSE